MIRAFLAASLLSVASAGVRSWAEKYCAQAAKLQSQKMVLDAEGMKKAYDEFKYLFAEKLDCSEDPYNPKVGFDLKDATFEECQAANAEAASHWASGQVTETTCIEIIADEGSHDGAVWLEFGNSGKLRSKFHTRAAMRFKVVDDKCVNYHTVFDSYNLLHPAESQTMALVAAAPAASHHHGHGGVKKFAKQYCAQVAKMGEQKLQMDPEGAKAAYAEFKSFFADTVTCSQDPYNPVIGYSLKDASFDDCQAAGIKAAANYDNAELSQITCIEIIADEDKGTGAIWVEFGNSGKLRSKFHARGAMRFAVEDGKCTDYHLLFDSYNLLPHDESEALAASLPYSSNAIAGFLVLSVFAAAALAGVKMSQKKKDILLENEVLG